MSSNVLAVLRTTGRSQILSAYRFTFGQSVCATPRMSATKEDESF